MYIYIYIFPVFATVENLLSPVASSETTRSNRRVVKCAGAIDKIGNTILARRLTLPESARGCFRRVKVARICQQTRGTAIVVLDTTVVLCGLVLLLSLSDNEQQRLTIPVYLSHTIASVLFYEGLLQFGHGGNPMK